MCTVLLSTQRLAVCPPRGRSRVPIVEVDRAAATTPRRRIVRAVHKWPPDSQAVATTTVGHAKSELPLRAWEFYHAAAKTELARGFTDEEAERIALGFSLQTDSLLLWNPNNLRLRDGGVFSRKDSSRTALAGRFGEAATYLLMIQQGYVYWDHVPSLIERAMNKARIAHRDHLVTISKRPEQ